MNTVCMSIINKHMFRKEGNTLCHVCFYSDTVRAIIGMLAQFGTSIGYAVTSSFIIAQLVQNRLGLRLGMTMVYTDGKHYL